MLSQDDLSARVLATVSHQTTLSETRFAKAASSAMLDFQESQALLAATISITAIIKFDGENRSGLANMLTLFSWMFNHRILQGLITAGMPMFNALVLAEAIVKYYQHAGGN